MKQSKTVLIAVLAVLVCAAVALLALQEAGVLPTEQGLVITEVVSSNSASLQDEIYGSPDWIELYNPSSRAVELKGYGIGRTDDSGELYFFEGGSIGPGEYLVVYCCAPVEGGAAYATGFNLPKRGTTLRLLDPSGATVQTLEVPKLEADVSYGVSAEGEYAYFASPTPGPKTPAHTLPRSKRWLPARQPALSSARCCHTTTATRPFWSCTTAAQNPCCFPACTPQTTPPAPKSARCRTFRSPRASIWPCILKRAGARTP